MPRRAKLTLVLAPEAVEHLDWIEAKYHASIQRAIDEQLCYTPEVPTRNRKSLEQPAPFDATWELRCGLQNRFRVFYDVVSDANTARVLAIGIKERDRLIIGGEEFRQ